MENEKIEDQLHEWMMIQRRKQNVVSMKEIIEKALSINPQFKQGESSKLTPWVYQFLSRKNLSVRTKTRSSQVLDAVMKPARREYCKLIVTVLQNYIVDLKYLVNMDETAVYLNCSPKRTVHRKREHTIPIRIGGGASPRFTLAVTVAMDGTKLPLFVIFKGTVGGSVERGLPSILPPGIRGFVQPNVWMDERSMHIWYEEIFQPYVSNRREASGLLFDDFVVPKDVALYAKMVEDNTRRFVTPPHYTSVLQPSNDGKNKSLKSRLNKCASKWRRDKIANMVPREKIPTPKREDVLGWLKQIWDEFRNEIVKMHLLTVVINSRKESITAWIRNLIPKLI